MTENGDAVQRFDAERLVSLGRVSAVAPSPDGVWLAVAVSRLDEDSARYVSDLWRVALVGDAPPVQLTRGPSNDRAPAFRRDGSLGFLSNRPVPGAKPEDTDEARSQVWLLSVHGGEPYAITDEPLGVGVFAFARAGDRLVVSADVLPGVEHGAQRAYAAEAMKKGPTALRYASMPVRYWDHWVQPASPHLIAYDENGGARRDLTPSADREHREQAWDLSADGTRVAITTISTGVDRNEDAAVLVIDTATGRTRSMGAASRVEHGAPKFSPDGRRVATLVLERVAGAHGKPTLWAFDADSGEGAPVAASWDRWPHLYGWTRDGAQLVVTADDQGVVPVFCVDVASGEVTRISAGSDGGTHEALCVAPSGREVYGVRHRLLHAPEPFRLALTPGARPEIIASLSGFSEADGAGVARWSSLEARADDGTAVQYFLLEPRAPGAKRPVLLWIHGGPMNQWADGWHWRWNPLTAVAAGYAVAMPNPRGSTGFGQEFLEGIWNNAWGAQCYRDVMAVTDAVAAHAGCDGARMAAMGGSFGGYMTNWIGGSTDRFRCLVTHASVFSMSAFYAVTDRPAWWLHMMGSHPYASVEEFDRHSPHRTLARWKSPTLVIHGERDYRVPVSEALALFEGLQFHGVESELLIFPDENHWILRPRNAVAWYRAVLGFLDKHLR